MTPAYVPAVLLFILTEPREAAPRYRSGILVTLGDTFGATQPTGSTQFQSNCVHLQAGIVSTSKAVRDSKSSNLQRLISL